MQSFVRRQNIKHYEKLLAGQLEPKERKLILKLLADERSKETLPKRVRPQRED